MLQSNINTLNAGGEAAAGLRINISKTKTLVSGSETTEKMNVVNKELENVIKFVYLGCLLSWDNDCGKEIRRRIAKALGAMARFEKVCRSKEISVKTKFSIFKACMISILLYASESGTLRKRDKDKLMAFEMRCYRWILNIRWQQMITNEEVRRRVKWCRRILHIRWQQCRQCNILEW